MKRTVVFGFVFLFILALSMTGCVEQQLSSGKDDLKDSLASMDLSEKATSDSPITNVNNIELMRDKENQVAISFYNKGTEACEDGARLDISCPGLEWSEASSSPVDVDRGSAETLGGIYSTDGRANEYACKVSVECGGSVVVSERASTQMTANPPT